MASYINKLSNAVTNATGSIIGRQTLTKISNSLNQSLYVDVAYRPLIKNGNIVQLISRNSSRSLQICTLPQDPHALILFGNGQIGNEFANGHFMISINADGYLMFSNLNNYICFEQNHPCIKNETDLIERKSKKKVKINFQKAEFRLHEIFGSKEYFALESVHCAGLYLSVTADGQVTTSHNKTDTNAHFKLFLIAEKKTDSVEEKLGAESTLKSDEKEEMEKYSNENENNSQESQILAEAPLANDLPPDYTSLYPKLPK